MAIRFMGKEEQYKGAVLRINEHMWMDGMLEETAVVWDSEARKLDFIQVGYYGIDGQNMNRCGYEADATVETWKQVIRYFLKPCARDAFAQSVIDFKREIRKGTHAEVVRGRKVKPGTKVEVFWVGDRPTYRSRQYDWMRETERIAGCYDEAGNKLWIKAEYLKNIDPIQSPNAKERKKFMKAYIDEQAHKLGAPWARR